MSGRLSTLYAVELDGNGGMTWTCRAAGCRFEHDESVGPAGLRRMLDEWNRHIRRDHSAPPSRPAFKAVP
jgi:hypothetical protein